VLVGLSGGSDSVALLFILKDLSEHGGFTLAGLGHLNHTLRATAGRDEAFCRALAERLELRILVETADVQQYARARQLSIEDGARRIRYEFLERAADQLGADQIAVGHTEDDQAETFLLKLMRGAGATGLAGIYPRRGRVIRPLLEVARHDLRVHLTAAGETWVEDETNDDLDNPRNRLRHLVLPQLAVTAGATVQPAIARAAGLIRDDGACLDRIAAGRYAALAVETAAGVELDAAGAAREPLAVCRRVLLLALQAGAGQREVGLAHVEAAMAVLQGTSAAADVPGSRVERRRGKLVVTPQEPWAK
jgi:tRNA(Ile)-lysidine synthase